MALLRANFRASSCSETKAVDPESAAFGSLLDLWCEQALHDQSTAMLGFKNGLLNLSRSLLT
jgi:hypothetical protein